MKETAKMSEDLEAMLTRACLALRDMTGFEASAEVKTADLFGLLGLGGVPAREEGEDDVAWLARCRRAELARVAPLRALRDRLLRSFSVDLQATHRGTYRIVPPGQQAARAERDGLRAARKALRDAAQRIQHVALDKLSGDERAARDAAMLNNASRLAFLSNRRASTVLAQTKESAEQSVSPDTPAMRE